MTRLRRIALRVPDGEAEPVRARLLELSPNGFEEVEVAGGSVELAVYASSEGAVELLATGLRGGSLLDVGCGSGVLSIAAVRLGFAPVLAVDVDPVAVETTRENAAANGVAVDAAVLDALAEPLPVADVAVANVLLGPVEAILSRLDAREAITSGYLAGEWPAHAGWEQVETVELDGWAADRFRRRRGAGPASATILP